MENNKILEIGDELFEYGNYGVYNRVTVERVTPKRAFLSDNKQIDRNFPADRYGLSPYGEPKSTSGLSHYRLSTPDLVRAWFDKQAKEKIKNYNFNKLSHETLVEIIKLLP